MNTMSLPEKEWFIKVPWGRLCIVAWGDCHNPPVLLCHGGMDAAISFRPILELLPKTFYYIGMEFPGAGKSDRYPPGLMLSVYDLAYAIEAVANHFRWDTFPCVGHSLGALTARAFNVANPGRISKLVELDPINFMAVEPEHFPLWYQTFFVEYFKEYHRYNMPREKVTLIKWKDTVEKMSQNRGISEEITAAILERMSEPAEDGLIRYTYDLRVKLVHSPPFSRDQLKKIYTALATPTLLVLADRSLKDGLFRNTTFLLDEKIYPNNNFRIRTVEGDHNVHVSNPERVAGYVAQFLLYGVEGLDGKSKL